MSTHNVYWTVENGTAKYTGLPTLMASVNGNKGTVTVPSKVTCSKGGSSVPITVTADVIPFADVKITLKTSTTKDGETTVDNSKDITPNAGESVTLKVGSMSGTLGFKCAAKVAGTKLLYNIDGTDKAQFSLSSTECAVTAEAAGTKPTAPKLTLTTVTASSKPALT